ncbi:MAG: hypothetical protein LBH76_05015, partial [Propionibacteriaceae bacterium]|nr:hypothetical protein [Propionibacteriaceae bacterium]
MLTAEVNGIPVTICETAQEAGRRAAGRVAALVTAAAAAGRARVVFASAPSQATMLSALADLDVPWPAV